jgi:hypothetical protein
MADFEDQAGAVPRPVAADEDAIHVLDGRSTGRADAIALAGSSYQATDSDYSIAKEARVIGTDQDRSASGAADAASGQATLRACIANAQASGPVFRPRPVTTIRQFAAVAAVMVVAIVWRKIRAEGLYPSLTEHE